jgi:hypothetical protein
MIDIFPLQKHADCPIRSVCLPAVKKIDFSNFWQRDQIMPMTAAFGDKPF